MRPDFPWGKVLSITAVGDHEIIKYARDDGVVRWHVVSVIGHTWLSLGQALVFIGLLEHGMESNQARYVTRAVAPNVLYLPTAGKES